MIIVVISGKQGSGKSTLAKRLTQEPDFAAKAHSLRFAQPLYEMHDAIRGILKAYNFDGYNYEKKDGNLLQLLGTEWGRQTVHEQIWVMLLLNKLRQLPPDSLVTVEDCRFENEFDCFNAVPGALRVRLEASRQTRKTRASMWREAEDHASETGLDQYAAMGKFDLTLDSDKYGEEEVFRIVRERIYMKMHTLEGRVSER